METMLDNKRLLYLQVKNWIINRIRNGEMSPNSKVPSERDLARRFKISRGTAKQALQELESENYIERISSKGSFVRDTSTEPLKHVNILFPFPEPAISKDLMDYAGFTADMEIYQGIMSVCGSLNARVTFQHMPDTIDKETLQSQVREVRGFDGAIFLGDSQLQGLKSQLRKFGIPYVTIHSGEELDVAGTTIVYNRSDIIAESANYIADLGYKSVGMLMNATPERSKENILASVFSDRKIEFKSEWGFNINSNEEKAYLELERLLPDDLNALPEIFFCASPIYSFAFLRVANKRGWVVPDDIAVFGYANNMELRPTVPMLTHVQVPYFEMGAGACRVLVEGSRGEFVVPARIIKGKTLKSVNNN